MKGWSSKAPGSKVYPPVGLLTLLLLLSVLEFWYLAERHFIPDSRAIKDEGQTKIIRVMRSMSRGGLWSCHLDDHSLDFLHHLLLQSQPHLRSLTCMDQVGGPLDHMHTPHVHLHTPFCSCAQSSVTCTVPPWSCTHLSWSQGTPPKNPKCSPGLAFCVPPRVHVIASDLGPTAALTSGT